MQRNDKEAAVIQGGNYQLVPIDNIELDKTNPRIRRFLEMYPEPHTAEQMNLALGAGSEDDGSGGATFEKLKNSILTYGGIIQPILLNKREDGTLICIEGNTRLALYKEFRDTNRNGDWRTIPALLYESIKQSQIDAIRLQIHLIGPRHWDPYSKAKYLHYLRTEENLTFDMIVEYCGGNKKEVTESIQAYEDMEKYFRPLGEESDFDQTRFSGFVELQKPGIKHSIIQANYTLTDFAKWIEKRKIIPLSLVRALPRILKNKNAREIFERSDAKKAEESLNIPDPSKTLAEADMGQLARALTQAISALPWGKLQQLKADPNGETAQHLIEAEEELKKLCKQMNEPN